MFFYPLLKIFRWIWIADCIFLLFIQKICISDDLQLPDVALARTSTGCSLSRTDGDELRNSSHSIPVAAWNCSIRLRTPQESASPTGFVLRLRCLGTAQHGWTQRLCIKPAYLTYNMQTKPDKFHQRVSKHMYIWLLFMHDMQVFMHNLIVAKSLLIEF